MSQSLQNSHKLVEDPWLYITSMQTSVMNACNFLRHCTHLISIAHAPTFRRRVWASATVCIVVKKSCKAQHAPLLVSAGSLSAVRGHQGAARSLHREQSDANAESSAIVFLGDHQVKMLHNLAHHELDSLCCIPGSTVTSVLMA